MATALGTANYETWGKFRCAYCLNFNVDLDSYAYSIDYYSGEKASADGSGLIRFPRVTSPQPTFASAFTGIGGQNFLLLDPVATGEFESAMTGQTVTLTGGTATISSALFVGTTSGSQAIGGTTNWSPVLSVGNLTGF